jgi:hypothetical protein
MGVTCVTPRPRCPSLISANVRVPWHGWTEGAVSAWGTIRAAITSAIWQLAMLASMLKRLGQAPYSDQPSIVPPARSAIDRGQKLGGLVPAPEKTRRGL